MRCLARTFPIEREQPHTREKRSVRADVRHLPLIPLGFAVVAPAAVTVPSAIVRRTVAHQRASVSAHGYTRWERHYSAPPHWHRNSPAARPVTFGDVAPMPCAVWQIEQLNPYCDTCTLCCEKLVLARICVKSWHFAHMAYGPVTVRSGLGKQIADQSARRRGLAELIIALEDMCVDRSMRAVGSGAAELAVVIAIVAIAAENSRSHRPRRGRAILIQHVDQQAGLRQRTRAIVRYRMARGRGRGELRMTFNGSGAETTRTGAYP